MNNEDDENMHDCDCSSGYDTDILSDEEEEDEEEFLRPAFAAIPRYKRSSSATVFKRFSDRLQNREKIVTRKRFSTSKSLAEICLPLPHVLNEPKRSSTSSMLYCPPALDFGILTTTTPNENSNPHPKTRNPFSNITHQRTTSSPTKSPSMLNRASRSKSMLDLGITESSTPSSLPCGIPFDNESESAQQDTENTENLTHVFQPAALPFGAARQKTVLLSLRRTTSDIPSPTTPIDPFVLRRNHTTGSLSASFGTHFEYPARLPVMKKTDSGELISSSTVIDLMQGKFSDKFTRYCIIDCRYKYEFEGGHIKRALSIIPAELEEQLQRLFFTGPEAPETDNNFAIIFHCEFSSKRGPKASKTLREMDRTANRARYPLLSYPYVYIMEGGYQNFYRDFPAACDGGYVEMKDERFKTHLQMNKKNEKTKRRSATVSSRGRGALSRSCNSLCIPSMRKF